MSQQYGARGPTNKEESILVSRKKAGVCSGTRKGAGVWAIALGVWAIVGLAIFINVDMGPLLLNTAIVVIALFAMVISACSLWLTRKHNKLMAKPFLDFSWNSPEPNALVLLNGGLGPGIITQVLVAVGDNDLKPATEDLWANIKTELGLGLFITRTFVGDTVIPVNSRMTLIENIVDDYVTVATREEENNCQWKLRTKVVYKSGYEESFETPIITLAKVPPVNLC